PVVVVPILFVVPVLVVPVLVVVPILEVVKLLVVQPLFIIFVGGAEEANIHHVISQLNHGVSLRTFNTESSKIQATTSQEADTGANARAVLVYSLNRLQSIDGCGSLLKLRS